MQNNILELAESYVQQFFEEKIAGEFVYHDFLHTRYVVEAAIQIGVAANLSDKEMEHLQLAAWFHDTGFYNGPDSHEKRGAALAEEFLLKHDYPLEEINVVRDCILATQLPQQPGNLLEQIMCDADLSHLGNELYWDRCGRVRQEMLLTQSRIMSEQEWVDFELDFMLRHSYHTEIARKFYEKRKNKHIKQLRKQKIRLYPDSEEVQEAELAQLEKLEKKKKKKKKDVFTSDIELKQINLGRGVETMFRTTYRTHVNLSSIADNKANIMLSITAIVISIVVANLVPKFSDNPKLIAPTFVLLAACLASLVFAILSTRPKVTEGRFTREDIEHKRSNLLFFGNFYNMSMDDFHWGMMEMIKDSDFLYSSMTRDLYFLGIVLAKKYRYLRFSYNIFMYGLILAVICFGLAYML
ncbi:MAG TPA: DUF5706 domain-containing protein [Saprospiraceae bacterium]|nr:DUF5706 domain-containing protein [Saprospiraceae bacterium]HMQ82003.1 DUF5706 domain-containing protein [Saprospiraceae bacterium]